MSKARLNQARAIEDITADAPARLDVAGRRTTTEWRDFFSSYSHIALVANSEDQRFETLKETLPETTLYVFFNRLDKVLKEPFSGHSLLVTRSNQAGSELVYRGILDRMVRLLPPPGFAGVVNLRTSPIERMNTIEEFGAVPAGLLDLSDYFEEFYPLNHTCSSGFGLALWLCENVPGPKIVLTGFSGQRGEKWKMFHIHDWTFEQTFLQILAEKGKLELDQQALRNPYALLARRFPDLSAEEVALGVARTLSLRLEASNRQIDRLISVTAPLRALYTFFRSLKRKSKKERVLAAARKQERRQ